MREGSDLVIFTLGVMVSRSLEAAEILKQNGVDAAVIDLYSIKPIDRDRILTYAKQCGRAVTVEEHSIYGGLGDAVSEALCAEYPIPMARIGVRDLFGCSSIDSEEMLRAYGLDAEGISSQILEFMKNRA